MTKAAINFDDLFK